MFFRIVFNKEGPLLMLSKQQTNTSSNVTQQTSLSVNSQKFKFLSIYVKKKLQVSTFSYLVLAKWGCRKVSA
jgi:hypothetical protein